MWHGPHQSAHRSSSTGVALRSTSDANVVSVTSIGRAVSGSGVLHFPQTALRPASTGGRRFFVPHDGHVMRRSVIAFSAENSHRRTRATGDVESHPDNTRVPGTVPMRAPSILRECPTRRAEMRPPVRGLYRRCRRPPSRRPSFGPSSFVCQALL